MIKSLNTENNERESSDASDAVTLPTDSRLMEIDLIDEASSIHEEQSDSPAYV